MLADHLVHLAIHLPLLSWQTAIRRELRADRSDGALAVQRIPKYANLMSTFEETLCTGHLAPEQRSEALISTLETALSCTDEHGRKRSPSHSSGLGSAPSNTTTPVLTTVKIILSFADKDIEAAKALMNCGSSRLQSIGMEFAPLSGSSPEWFTHCKESDVCVLLLSADYVWAYHCEAQLTYAKVAP